MAVTKRRPYTPRMPAEARREQLLDAALEIVARTGYAGVSIDAIAREASVSRTVVYGVYDSLDELLYALLDRQERRAMAQLLDALPEDLGDAAPEVVVLAVIRQWAEAVAGDPLTWRPILLAPEGTPGPVHRRIERDRELMRVRLRALLTLALGAGEGAGAGDGAGDGTGDGTGEGPTVDSGTSGPGFDTDMAAHAVIGLAEYFGRLIVADPDGFELDRLLAAVESLLIALRGSL